MALVMKERDRTYYGYLEGEVSIVINLVLSILKFGVGIYINSIALIVDAFHTLSDLFTSVVVILGFRAAKRPPDKEHPFGHGRYEHIATLVIAVLLSVVGFEFLLTSTQRLLEPQEVRGTLFFTVVVLLTVVVKEALAQFSFKLARKIDSSTLMADGWHHRSDALAAIPVAIGILASSYHIYWLDALFGIVVSAIIIYTGYSIAKASSSSLMGKGPDESFIERVKHLALLKGVTDVSNIQVHEYGLKKVISLSVKVEPMGVEEAHALADSIEERLKTDADATATVHVDGFTEDESVKERIYTMVKKHDEVLSCHAIDIGDKIDFHILLDKDMSIEKAHNLADHLEKEVARRFGKAVIIHAEPCIESCEHCKEECEKRV